MRGTVPVMVSFLFAYRNFKSHHSKGPMSDRGDTIKSMVFRKVLLGNTAINTPNESANTVSRISCLYLPNDDLLEETDDVKECTPTSNAIKMPKILLSYT